MSTLPKLISRGDFRRLASEGKAPSSVRLRFGAAAVVAKAEGEDAEKRGDRARSFTISSEAVDREDDTLALDGWDLGWFGRAGVVLWAHNHWDLPIAKPSDTRVADGALKSWATFAEKDLNPLADTVMRMYDEGFLHSVSVGFRPLEHSYVSEDGRNGVHFARMELLEYSAVPVPCNPDAMIDARGKGIDLAPLAEWSEVALDGGVPLLVPRRGIEALWKALGPEREAHAKQYRRVREAISWDRAHPNGTPKAAEDATWDGAAEVAAADVAMLVHMSAWMDPEQADAKTGYKLPHHRAAEEHAVVLAGVQAAMGALLGARGGADIPEADRAGVWEHLAKHYREFDREPPELRTYTAEELAELFPEKAAEPSAPTPAPTPGPGSQEAAGPAPERKVGRVLSAKNEQALRKAVELLGEVLAQLDQEEAHEPEAKAEPAEDAADDVIELDLGEDEQDEFDGEDVLAAVEAAMGGVREALSR